MPYRWLAHRDSITDLLPNDELTIKIPLEVSRDQANSGLRQAATAEGVDVAIHIDILKRQATLRRKA